MTDEKVIKNRENQSFEDFHVDTESDLSCQFHKKHLTKIKLEHKRLQEKSEKTGLSREEILFREWLKKEKEYGKESFDYELRNAEINLLVDAHIEQYNLKANPSKFNKLYAEQAQKEGLSLEEWIALQENKRAPDIQSIRQQASQKGLSIYEYQNLLRIKEALKREDEEIAEADKTPLSAAIIGSLKGNSNS